MYFDLAKSVDDGAESELESAPIDGERDLEHIITNGNHANYSHSENNHKGGLQLLI